MQTHDLQSALGESNSGKYGSTSQQQFEQCDEDNQQSEMLPKNKATNFPEKIKSNRSSDAEKEQLLGKPAFEVTTVEAGDRVIAPLLPQHHYPLLKRTCVYMFWILVCFCLILMFMRVLFYAIFASSRKSVWVWY